MYRNNDQISFIIIRHPRSDTYGIRTQKMSDRYKPVNCIVIIFYKKLGKMKSNCKL